MFVNITICSIIINSVLLLGAQKIEKLDEKVISNALKDIDTATRNCNFEQSNQYYRLDTTFYFLNDGNPTYSYTFKHAESAMRKMMDNCSYNILKDYYSELDIDISKNGLKGESTSNIKYDIKYLYESEVIYTEHVEVKNLFIIRNNELIIVEVHWNILDRIDITKN